MKKKLIKSLIHVMFSIACLIILSSGIIGGYAFMNSSFSSQGGIVWELPSGTSADPFLIFTAADFNSFANSGMFSSTSPRYYFRQIDDITTSTALATVNLNGFYDGNGHSITINASNNSLFLSVGSSSAYSSSYVKNLTVTTQLVSTSSATSVGGIAQFAYGSFENVSFDGAFSSNPLFARAGGIVANAYATGNKVSFKNCKNYATIYGFECIGGILAVGESDSGNCVVEDCFNYGAVCGVGNASQPSTFSGGIMGGGFSGWTIRNCANYASLSVTPSRNGAVGGIAGQIFYGTKVYRSANFGSLSGSSTSAFSVGGIVATALGSTSLIECCYNSGTITGSGSSAYLGGITATNGTATANSGVPVRYCYNVGYLSGGNYRGGISGQNLSGIYTANYWIASRGATNFYGAGNTASGNVSFAYNSAYDYSSSTFTPLLANASWTFVANKAMVIGGLAVSTADLPRLAWE